jgi:hypothetical protein
MPPDLQRRAQELVHGLAASESSLPGPHSSDSPRALHPKTATSLFWD